MYYPLLLGNLEANSVLLVRIFQYAPVNDIHRILEGATGSNLLYNNVNAMSLARTHRKCRPHSLKLNPNFSEFGLHLAMRPR